MGQKAHPKSLRLGINTGWASRWFRSSKDYVDSLRQDVGIREFIRKEWKSAGISDVDIERSAGFVRMIVRTARPGMVIGRGGNGIESMTLKLKAKFFAGKKIQLKLDIQEVRNYEEDALLLAQNVAEQLEKRMPFRRVLKSSIDQVKKNKNLFGVKIEVSGRLGGAEMSRSERLSHGTIPLHTLRANIDYGYAIAYTTYGTIGVKVWLYKGIKVGM
ncbi:MAG: 30S ribosomal protein S3 [Candidatus Moraniibacteriota bacterium]|nr:MAG: 30S ribosomal protein S3 [Candidatus Moranbacteria bacterium]